MRADRGVVTVAMTGVIATLAVVLVATGALALAYATRNKAITAADATALAAAVATYPPAGRGAPSQEARGTALLNRANLISCRCPITNALEKRTVEVVVEIPIDVPIFGRLAVRGTARAEFDPRLWLGR